MEAEGTIQNSYNENIILTYEFDASSERKLRHYSNHIKL